MALKHQPFTLSNLFPWLQTQIHLVASSLIIILLPIYLHPYLYLYLQEENTVIKQYNLLHEEHISYCKYIGILLQRHFFINVNTVNKSILKSYNSLPHM